MASVLGWFAVLTRRRVSGLLGAVVATACYSTSGDGGFETAGGGAGAGGSGQTCEPGRERCDCRLDASCDSGLVCLSQLCVAAPSGSGGSTSEPSGGGGSAGSEPPLSGGTAGTGTGVGAGGGGPGPVHDGGLILNGDFSLGGDLWKVEPADVPAGVKNGSFCVEVHGYAGATLGWPATPEQAFALQSGVSYRFAFAIKSTDLDAVSVLAKVGHAEAPFWSHHEAPVALSSDFSVVSETFTVNIPDDKAGVAFIFQGKTGDGQTEICVDDVSVEVAP